MTGSVTQFIWLYFHKAACGDELRYSMRSVQQHFRGTPHIILVGDKPDWYYGQYIDVPQIATPRYSRFHAVLDSSHKLQQVLQHTATADNFVIMMDDHYFLRDFSLTDLQVPRCAAGWTPKKRCWWDDATTLTMQVLERRGLSTHLYETHLMHVFEKEKMQQVFDAFSPTTVPVLRNTLYGNMFRKNPKDCRSFIATPQSRQTVPQLDAIAKRVTVLNHASAAWDRTLQQWLQHRLSTPAVVELPDTATVGVDNAVIALSSVLG